MQVDGLAAEGGRVERLEAAENFQSEFQFRRSLFLASTTAFPVALICYAADLVMISSEGP
ncbi:hypothetical protein Bca4012_099863 [Brassica carinata]